MNGVKILFAYITVIKGGKNMKVIDIISICNDNTKVDIINNDTAEVLTQYDGKNSIDKKYNDCVVKSVNVFNNTLTISI